MGHGALIHFPQHENHPMTSIALITGASGGIGRDIDRLADAEALLRSAAATYASQGLRVNAVAPTD